MLIKISCALSLGHARSVPSRSAHRRSAGRPRIPGAAHAVQVSRLQILKGLRLPRGQPLMSKDLVKPLNIATGPILTPLPAEGELTPRALTSSYTTLGVRPPKQLNISVLAWPRNGLKSSSSASEGLEKE